MIDLGNELKKPLDEIKTASNRILIIVCFIAIGTLWYGLNRSNNARIKDCEAANVIITSHIVLLQLTVDSLKEEELLKSEKYNQRIMDENDRLRYDKMWRDSINHVLQIIIKGVR